MSRLTNGRAPFDLTRPDFDEFTTTAEDVVAEHTRRITQRYDRIVITLMIACGGLLTVSIVQAALLWMR